MSIIYCGDDYDLLIAHLLKYYNTFEHLREFYKKNNKNEEYNLLDEKLYLCAKLILLLDKER